MSDIAKKRIAQERKNKTGQLDLGKCGLTDIETQIPELFELSWLRVLNFSNQRYDGKNQKWIESPNQGPFNCLERIPTSIGNLQELRVLRMNGTSLTEPGFSDRWKIDSIPPLQSLQKLEVLDLSHNRLKKIEGLGALSQLRYLYLDNNWLEKIESLEQLTNLTTLYLKNNRLKAIRGLEQLAKLEILRLDGNQIRQIEGLEQLRELHKLDLGSNQINKIEGLEQLTKLRSLNFFDNRIKKIEGLEQLTKLQSLLLTDNQLKKIEGLEQLTKLKRLSLVSNSIKKIEGLEQLAKLNILELGDNRIKKIEGLEQLTKLGTLNLFGNRIKKIEGLQQLAKLQSLSLSNNQLKKIEKLEHLTKLNVLELGGNQLKKIEGIKQLTKLNILNLGNNQLKKIEGIKHLTKLNVLKLSRNQLKKIEGIKQLKELHTLHLSSNQLKKIEEIKQLTKLNYLDLRVNRIKKIERLDNCTNLNRLNLAHNPISTTAYLKKLSQLKSIVLYGCPLKDVPDALLGDNFFRNCLTDLKNWWKATEDPATTEANRQVKLMFSGNGGTGKSTLAEAMEVGKCQAELDSTHGIQLKSLDYEQDGASIRFHIWDFGGQEIYHGTHRLFLQSAALQLVLFDPKTEKKARKVKLVPDRITGESVRDFPLLYWTDTIRTLSPQSPLVVIQNKKGKHPKVDEKARQQILPLEQTDFHQTDAKTGEGLSFLKHLLLERAQQIREYGMLMPKTWLAVREYFFQNLSDKGKSKRIMLCQEFNQLCLDHGVIKKTIPSLLKLLHHSGVLYHHPDYLGDHLLIDQRWALEAIYTPFKRGSDFYEHMRKDWLGKVRVKNLFSHLKTDTENEKWLLLHFMRSCGICYPMGEINRHSQDQFYIFPEFLIPTEPEAVVRFKKSKLDKYYFQRSLKYFNLHRIQKFICKVGNKTTFGNIWRSGLLLDTPEGKVIVEMNAKKLALQIHMEKRAVGKWLPELIDEFEKGHQDTFKNWQESTNGKHYRKMGKKSFRQLVKDKQGATSKQQGAHQQLSLIEQLPTVVPPSPTLLFVSYARADEAYKDTFIQFLNPLKRNGRIHIWADSELNPGARWNDTIKEELDRADIVVFLISAESLASDYIYDVELSQALKNQKSKGQKIVPIVLRNCGWKDSAFNDFNVLPSNGRTIVDYKDESKAWKEIYDQLKKLLPAKQG